MEHHKKKELSLILWEKIQTNDDKSAFDQFYLFYVEDLFKYGYSLFSDEGLIYDCIQELFLHIWIKRKKITFKTAPKAYLLISLRRLVLKKKPKNTLVDIDTVEMIAGQTNEIYTNPKEQIDINTTIQKLPKRQKEAIYLKYIENLDYQEIASIMDISVPSVYKSVSAAIKKLRTRLTLF